MIEYSGERTLDGLSRFLETDGEYGQSAPDQVELTRSICSEFTQGGVYEQIDPFTVYPTVCKSFIVGITLIQTQLQLRCATITAVLATSYQ